MESRPSDNASHRAGRALHVESFGPEPESAPTILAIHGLTGHGRRWRYLAQDLPEVRVVAPDLIGHGYSPFTPQWTYDANVDALFEVIATHIPAPSPMVIVGHSFGGALSLRLAARLLESGRGVDGLILLDPAQGLDPERCATVAAASLDHWDYDDADHARAAKRGEGWALVPDAILDAEIADHLIDRENGRVGWRVSAPAAATAWNEMSRPAVLPPPGVPTTIVVADRVDPPFVTDAFLDECARERPDVRIVHADCEHMVPFLEPELVAALIRSAHPALTAVGLS